MIPRPAKLIGYPFCRLFCILIRIVPTMISFLLPLLYPYRIVPTMILIGRGCCLLLVGLVGLVFRRTIERTTINTISKKNVLLTLKHPGSSKTRSLVILFFFLPLFFKFRQRKKEACAVLFAVVVVEVAGKSPSKVGNRSVRVF